MREHRVIPSDPRAARQRQVESTADAVTVNRGNDRFRTRRNHSQHRLPTARKCKRRSRFQSRYLRNLRSHRKRVLTAANHRAAKFRRLRQPRDFALERVHHGYFQPRESVAALKLKQKDNVL